MERLVAFARSLQWISPWYNALVVNVVRQCLWISRDCVHSWHCIEWWCCNGWNDAFENIASMRPNPTPHTDSGVLVYIILVLWTLSHPWSVSIVSWILSPAYKSEVTACDSPLSLFSLILYVCCVYGFDVSVNPGIFVVCEAYSRHGAIDATRMRICHPHHSLAHQMLGCDAVTLITTFSSRTNLLGMVVFTELTTKTLSLDRQYINSVSGETAFGNLL